MVKVVYRSRILTDIDFLKSQECDKETLLHLMYIKASSYLHPKEHNIILEEDANSLLGEGGLFTFNKLGASFNKIRN